MDMPPVPPSVRALATSGQLPPDLAALFAPPGREKWTRIAEAVDERLDEVDPAVRGAFALAGAYGHLDDIEFLGPGEMDEHNDRAIALLEEALEHGVPEEEAEGLWDVTLRVPDVAHLVRDHEEYLAEHGTTASGRLKAKLDEADARYAAGDRAGALVLFREIGEADLWGEFSGAMEVSDLGWCRLLQDAVRFDGPEATRRIWQAARASRHAARFPHPHWSVPLAELLMGAGVPDILEVVVAERLDAALRDHLPWELSEDERWTLSRAIDELEQHHRA